MSVDLPILITYKEWVDSLARDLLFILSRDSDIWLGEIGFYMGRRVVLGTSLFDWIINKVNNSRQIASIITEEEMIKYALKKIGLEDESF